MDNPSVATKETAQYVKTAFNLNPMLPLAVEMSNQVFVRPGLSCSAKDVVLVQTESGQYPVPVLRPLVPLERSGEQSVPGV